MGISNRPARDVEIVVGEPARLAETLAHRLEAEARRAILLRGRFVLALPGGSVAEQLLPRLASAALDPGRTDLCWVDERAVPPTSPESNYGIAARLWLDRPGGTRPRLHRMPADSADLELAAAAYQAELEGLAGEPPRLDAVLLGVGADGHVASLFAGAPSLEVDDRAVVAIGDAPKPPARRLSLTLPTLARASLVVVAAFGAAKAAAIEAALAPGAAELPVARLCAQARRPLFLLDPGAASRRPADS